MTTVMVELLVAGLIVVLVALLDRPRTAVIRARRPRSR